MYWDIISSSVAGTKHTKVGKGCDDAHGFWSNGKVSVFAVADGAGSASYGALGSDLATKTLINVVKQKSLHSKLPDNKKDLEVLASYLVNIIRYELEKKALGFSSPNTAQENEENSKENNASVIIGRQGRKQKYKKKAGKKRPDGLFRVLMKLFGFSAKKETNNYDSVDKNPEYGHPSVTNIISDKPPPLVTHEITEKNDKHRLQDYSTTILAVIVTSRWLLALQVGDGLIVIQQNDKLVPLTTPTKGSYYNVTSFVTSNSYLSELQHFVVPNIGIDRIFLMTDGLENLAINFKTNVAQPSFFKNFIDYFEEIERGKAENQQLCKNDLLADILNSKQINRQTDDDKTLLMATKQKAV